MVRDEEPYKGNSLLVGWYHSHPTFDAYLSELDQQTQRQFFGELWNVAIVVGPLRRQRPSEGWTRPSRCSRA